MSNQTQTRSTNVRHSVRRAEAKHESSIVKLPFDPGKEKRVEHSLKLMSRINSTCGKAEAINLKLDQLKQAQAALTASQTSIENPNTTDDQFTSLILGLTGIFATICLSILFMSPVIGIFICFMAYVSSTLPTYLGRSGTKIITDKQYLIASGVIGLLVILLGLFSQPITAISFTYGVISGFALTAINFTGTKPLEYLISSSLKKIPNVFSFAQNSWLSSRISRLERAYRSTKRQAKVAEMTSKCIPLAAASKTSLSPVPQFTNEYFLEFFSYSPFGELVPPQKTTNQPNHTDNPAAIGSEDQNELEYHQDLQDQIIRHDDSEIR